MRSRRMMLGLLLATTLCLITPPGETAGHAAAAKGKKKAGKATLYVRYEDDGDVSYGILEGKKIVFHLLPSAICHDDIHCYIGRGVVVSLDALFEEIEEALARP